MAVWRKGNRLPLVRESQARGRTTEVYEDIKAVLGVAHVSLLFQAYASFPPFLDLHWTRLRPLLASREYFGLADRLRADAYTRMHNYFEIPDLAGRVAELGLSAGAREEVGALIELFHYLNPLLLLTAAVQLQAFEHPVGRAAEGTSPAPRPTFADSPVLIAEESATPAVRKLYAEIKHTLELPFVGTTYQALARWPDFLRAYWESVRPILQSPMYGECMHGVRATAWSLSNELPGTFSLTLDELADSGMKDDDITSVVRITDVFIPDLTSMLLQIEAAKIGLEGGSRRLVPAKKTTPGRAPEAAA